jgi:tungstate transport system substrate-binding protein
MLRSLFLLLLALLLATPVLAEEHLRLSTTTSTENSGLLKVLLPPFEAANGCKVDVIAVGTGKALKLGEAGDVDVVLVHARKLEDQFVAAGFGIERRDVMYNDFVVLGPADDPAGVKGSRSATEVLARIAAKGVTFISRGDESGTHQKEKELWTAAGLQPTGAWYVQAGQGMGEVLIMATEKRAYTLADRGTYNAYRGGKTDLAVLFAGDPTLFNPYGVILVNPARYPQVKLELARKFSAFLTGPLGQALIAGFRVNDEAVFFAAGP